MKIAFSGPANSGKTTLIKEFVNTWPMYATPAESYRDILKKDNIEHSDKTTEKTQDIILSFMEKQLEEFKDAKNIVYDRCPLDVLVYTMQAQLAGKIGDDFAVELTERVKNAISKLDAIFILPYDENIPIEDNGTRNTNVEYIKQTDRIFQAIMDEYYNNFDDGVFFPKAGHCPGIIMLEDKNKILQLKGLIAPDGGMYSADDDHNLEMDFANAINTALEGKKKAEEFVQQYTADAQEENAKADLTSLTSDERLNKILTQAPAYPAR